MFYVWAYEHFQAMRYLVEDARYMIGEASSNLSIISFNVVAPNNDLQTAYNLNFQELL